MPAMFLGLRKCGITTAACLLSAAWTVAGEVIPERIPLTFVEQPHRQSRVPENQLTSYLNPELKLRRAQIPYPSPSGSVPLEYRKEGILIDRNLDGRLDDADFPLIKNGEVFSLPYAFDTRQVAYHFRYLEDGDETDVIVHGLSHLSSSVNGWQFDMADGSPYNCRFGDIGKDVLYISRPGQMPVRYLWRPTMMLEDRLWDCAIIEHGSVLTFSPHPGPTARVILATAPDNRDLRIAYCKLSLTEIHGAADITITFGEVPSTEDHGETEGPVSRDSGLTLPGDHKVWGLLAVQLPRSRIMKDGKSTSVLELYPAFPKPFHLPDGETRLTFGIPDHFSAVVCMPEPGLILVESAELNDLQGNAWNARRTGRDGTEIAFFISTSGTETRIGKLEYG